MSNVSKYEYGLYFGQGVWQLWAGYLLIMSMVSDLSRVSDNYEQGVWQI